MTTTAKLGTLLTIGDADFKAGYQEARSPHLADYRINTDATLVEVIRAMLTEVAEEGHLTEQRVRQSTGFILGLVSLE
jgi:hypothetical protein